MVTTRSSIKIEDANTIGINIESKDTNLTTTVNEKQQMTTPRLILPKRVRDGKSKEAAPILIDIPSKMPIEPATESAIKRKPEVETTTTTKAKRARATKVKAESIVKEESTVKIEISANPELSEPVVKAESSVKKEPKAKAPRLKKEPKPKIPKVKKEPKPKAPKRKPAFKLPPEASIYMDDAMHGRVTRAMKQRMFVMSRELSAGNDSIENFEVLGSIGNAYTVSIAPRMKCTCMDYALRRTHCKHILMVLLKVYRLPFDSQMFRSLNTTREQRLEARTFARVVDPSVLVPQAIRQKILGISHENHPEAEPVIENTNRRPLDTSDCPICFEEFEEQKIDDIEFCKTCGNNVHKECFQMWVRSKGSNISCVYCRSKWVFASSSSASSGPSKKSVRQLDSSHINEFYYANFAAELGITRKRDTSTYKTNGRYSFYDHEYDI